MIKIYYTTTEYEPWTIHDLFNELSAFFKKGYNASTITKFGGHTYIPQFDYSIGDCEIFIYNEEKDILNVISFSETKTKVLDILYKRNNSNDILIVLHQLGWGLNSQNKSSYKFQIKKTSFYPFSPKINYSYYYNLKQLINHSNTIEKMFLKTTTGRGDEKKLAELGYINDSFPPMQINDYLNLAITYRVGLSISGGAYELCHRDFDYMAIGLPLLRLELIDTYDPILKPNYHYIAVNRNTLPKDTYLDLRGGDNYISAYWNRFIEIKNDYDFLQFISDNARIYYENFASPNIKIKPILNKLNIV